jgi:hypothetical protein
MMNEVGMHAAVQTYSILHRQSSCMALLPCSLAKAKAAHLSDAPSAVSAALQGYAGTLGGTNTKMQFVVAGIKTHTELGAAGRVCDSGYNNDFCTRQAIDW